MNHCPNCGADMKHSPCCGRIEALRAQVDKLDEARADMVTLADRLEATMDSLGISNWRGMAHPETMAAINRANALPALTRHTPMETTCDCGRIEHGRCDSACPSQAKATQPQPRKAGDDL